MLGNPPYGYRNVLTNDEKRYFRKIRNIEFKSGDSAELFVKISFDQLVKANGILTFIIPKKSLYGEAWEDTRMSYWGKNNFLYCLDAGKSFQNVLLEAVVFGVQKKTQSNNKIQLGFLRKDGTIERFWAENFNSILSSANTIQIYSVLYKSIYDKVQERRMRGSVISGKLGLAIGTDFYSDNPKKYKLLKGIDVTRYQIRSNRFLNNQEKLDWKKAQEFLKPKIICQRLVAHILYPKPHLKFASTYDNEGIIITNTLTSFELDNQIDEKFFIGYLNSKFTGWYAYNFVYCQAIRGMDLYNFYIQQIAIPNCTLLLQQPIITLVNQILEAKQENPQADTSDWENEIDQLVYQLYGLTDKEIAVVEEK